MDSQQQGIPLGEFVTLFSDFVLKLDLILVELGFELGVSPSNVGQVRHSSSGVLIKDGKAVSPRHGPAETRGAVYPLYEIQLV